METVFNFGECNPFLQCLSRIIEHLHKYLSLARVQFEADVEKSPRNITIRIQYLNCFGIRLSARSQSGHNVL